MAVGVIVHYDGNTTSQGHIHFYESQSLTYASGQFGYSLDVASDGSVVIVGSPTADVWGEVVLLQPMAGSSYYDISTTLSYLGSGTYEDFGSVVALAGDGKQGEYG